MTDHLDDIALFEFLSETVTPDISERIQAHLEGCAPCRERLGEVKAVHAAALALRERYWTLPCADDSHSWN